MNDNVTQVDEFRPDYEVACESCGARPTVDAVLKGVVVHSTQLCGPCTWGEEAMTDPAKWNE